MAKVSYPDIDKIFEKMSRSAAEKMNGTHPPVKTAKKKAKAKPKKRTTKK